MKQQIRIGAYALTPLQTIEAIVSVVVLFWGYTYWQASQSVDKCSHSLYGDAEWVCWKAEDKGWLDHDPSSMDGRRIDDVTGGDYSQ